MIGRNTSMDRKKAVAISSELLTKSAIAALSHFAAVFRSADCPLSVVAEMVRLAYEAARRGTDGEYGEIMAETFNNLVTAARELSAHVVMNSECTVDSMGDGATDGN